MNYETASPDRVHVVRQSVSMDHQQFARALGVSPSTVAEWESGESEPTTYHAVVINRIGVLAQENAERARRAIDGLGSRSAFNLFSFLFS